MSYICGASIDGPKIYANVVLWRKSCRVLVSGPTERCRFHGKPCPVCGRPMYDRPGGSHLLSHTVIDGVLSDADA